MTSPPLLPLPLLPPPPAGKQMLRLTVRPETALVRPFVVAAVLRGLRFDATRYASFIDLQVGRWVGIGG